MTIATIDIGTNTILLLVAQVDTAGNITPLVYEQRVPRLGKGVDAARNLQPESMNRVVGVLREYNSIIARHSPDRIVAAATSAVRDARNSAALIDLVKREAGLDVEVLSGDDEALWTYRGAISGIPDIGRATVLDIGGGSTEISIGDRDHVHKKSSLDMGSVRLTERFFKHDPPTHPELEAAITHVEDELARPRGFEFRGTRLIGVAGTATALAILDQDLREFSIRAIINYRLTYESVNTLFRKLRSMPSSDILALSTMMEGRSDIMIAGSLILREVMAHYKFSDMTVSERGVRYGLAIREWMRSQQPGVPL